MTETDKPIDSGQAYFEAIETIFIRLRGAPLLLSPTDWQVANEWFEAGIPLELVRRALETVFTRRKERGEHGRVQSLRYCSEAVWRAWNEARELEAGGARRTASAMNVRARLSGISGSLPAQLPGREQWVREIESLEGSSEEIERALAELESKLLLDVEGSLSQPDEQRLTARVDEVIASLEARLPEAEIESVRSRIRRGALRELSGLPLLSLFSSEATAADRDRSS